MNSSFPPHDTLPQTSWSRFLLSVPRVCVGLRSLWNGLFPRLCSEIPQPEEEAAEPHELTDAAWAVMEPLLPVRSKGMPWRDHRQVINGILWVLASGRPWSEAPKRYGPAATLTHRFSRWRRDGTWERLMDALLTEMDRQRQIPWEPWRTGGESLRALQEAVRMGKKPRS
jgi:transposase